MAAEASRIYPILGTMTFGADGQVQPAAAGVLVRTFAGAGCAKVPALDGLAMVDTARIYQQATPDGDTEATLGDLLASSPSLGDRLSIATKANPGVAPHFSLSRQSVLDQCHTSLEKLGLECMDLFYLHSPDIKTDIGETLAAVEQLHAEGKIREFGLSNYPAWAVVDIWHRCKARGMVLPTVYQGVYNVLARTIEPEIVPVCREFGLRLYIYNPLAGGLLVGKYSSLEDLTGAKEGRFSGEFSKAFGSRSDAGQMYRNRFGQQATFDGLEVIRRAAAGFDHRDQMLVPAVTEAEGTPAAPTVTESSSVVNGVRMNVRVEETVVKPREQTLPLGQVALRWLIHHSLLAKGDGIILGASKPEHLLMNLAAWRAGPLPPLVAAACEEAWEVARPACESYFRGYGAKAGGIERFLELKADAANAVDAEAEAEEPAAKVAKTR